MSLDYLSEQSQFREFMFELDRLFVKYNIDNVYVVNNAIQFQRGDDDGWFFDSWLVKKDGARRFSRPGINENRFGHVSADMYAFHADSIREDNVKTAVVPATVEPLIEEPGLKGTVIVPKATVIRTDPTGTETLSVTTIKADMEATQDNKQDIAVVETWDTAKQEQAEQEINPKINEYINELADKLYAEAKARNFPKNTLGEYWTHPAVVRAVKQNGFNESAYLIISANTTYWHMLADRMKEVEQLDKQKNQPKNATKSVVSDKIAEAVAELEPVAHMETFSTDTILGTWTVHYSDYKDSVFIDSGKGRTAIISKVHNWMLIFSRMHPELKNAPTRINISETFTENFDKQQSFRYKWYEFVVDVSYSTPLESEDTDNA